jgi:voltage-gated potassium channel
MSTADTDPVPRADLDDSNGRLRAYLAKTQTPLDVLALLTLWIVVVPPSDFGSADHASTMALIVRVALSVVYGIDITIRATLARRHWQYVRAHPLSVLVVAFPPLRLFLSLRLIRSVFRRGNLERFLLAASVLVLNGAIIVYLFERHAKGSNIHTLGQSVWWSMTTVTTVGYGDYAPVTTGGRIVASLIMAIGIVTLAVVTAQVSSSFIEQAARRRAATVTIEPDPTDASMADIASRLARIEELLASPSTPPE